MQRGCPNWMLVLGALVALYPVISFCIGRCLLERGQGCWLLATYIAISVAIFRAALIVKSRTLVVLIFTVFFLVSFPLRIQNVEANKELWMSGGGFATTAGFDFSEESYKIYYAVSLIGMLGIFAGSGTGFYFLRHKKSQEWALNKKQLYLIFCVWIVLSLSLELICLRLNIGRSGVVQPNLPLHATGIIFHAKNSFLPMLGWFIFSVAYESGLARLKYWVVAAAFLMGLLSAYAMLSKAGLMYAVLPYLLYVCFRAPWDKETRRLLSIGGLLLLIALPIVFFGAMVLREEAYNNWSGNRVEKLGEILDDHKVKSHGGVSLISGTISNVFTRVTGGSELMGVIAASPQPEDAIWRLLLGRGASEESGTAEMIKAVYGVSVGIGSDTFTGKSFGLIPSLYLRHSLSMVLIGCFAYAFLVTIVEQYVRWKCSSGVAVGVAFWLAMRVWESGYDLLIQDPAVIITFCLLIGLTLKRRSNIPLQRPRTAAV